MKIKTVFLVMFLALALLLGGCASVKTAVTAVQTVLCNPTDEQKSQAEAAKNFISQAAAYGATVAGAPITADVALAILNNVQNGVCVALVDLQAALDYLDKVDNAVRAQVQARDKMGKALNIPPTLPDLTALRAAMK